MEKCMKEVTVKRRRCKITTKNKTHKSKHHFPVILRMVLS